MKHQHEEQPRQPARKAWQKPALIVLVRRKPEEAVLQACKNFFEESPSDVCFSEICFMNMPS